MYIVYYEISYLKPMKRELIVLKNIKPQAIEKSLS